MAEQAKGKSGMVTGVSKSGLLYPQSMKAAITTSDEQIVKHDLPLYLRKPVSLVKCM